MKIINEFSSLTKQIDQPFILGCPENDDNLLQEASELSSLEKIKATNQKLVGDAVPPLLSYKIAKKLEDFLFKYL